jgi:hypothetical protein
MLLTMWYFKKFGRSLGIAILIGTVATSCSMQQNVRGKKAEKQAAVPKADPSLFDRVIPAGTKFNAGLFKTYFVGGKYYFEIPDTLLGRPMIVITRFKKTPFGLATPQHQYGGEKENEQVWTWERHGRQIFIQVQNYKIMADAESGMQQAVASSNLPPILAAFDIKAVKGSGVLIDVTDFYGGDTPAIGITDDEKKALKVTALDLTRSYIDTIKSFRKNVETDVIKTYRASDIPNDKTIGAVTFEMTTSMLLLPSTLMKSRFYDNRLNYIHTDQQNFGADPQKMVVTRYIQRWRLEPKDEGAYARGELVEPKKQIIYYIDPATPKQWVPYLIKGINDWQKAFEAAGFKNAIIGKAAPTKAEDPEFDTEDSRYNVVRYFASDTKNAYADWVVDPRTGEILESRIGWYFNEMKELHDWYFIQTAAANPAARNAHYSEEQMGEMIRYTCAHEIGHSLGQEHNWGASAAYPVDSLRSPSFTSIHGTEASIMDYARFNYVAQPGDGVTQFSPKIGEYDLWSVKWGYSWFPGDLQPNAEKTILNAWTLAKSGNPLYFFGRQFTGFDARSQNEDLGDNAITAGNYGIANLKRLLPNLSKWGYEKGQDYEELKAYYNQVLEQYARYTDHVSRYIGGMMQTNRNQEQQQPTFVYISKHRQEEAVSFLIKNSFDTQLWLIDKTELAKFDYGIVTNTIKQIQLESLQGLLSYSRLARMYDAQIKNGDTSYKVTALLTALRIGIFNTPKPDAFKRNLQRGYVEILKKLLRNDFITVEGEQVWQKTDAGNTPINANLSDIKPMMRAELKTLGLALQKGADADSKAHFADLHERINTALNNALIEIKPVKN